MDMKALFTKNEELFTLIAKAPSDKMKLFIDVESTGKGPITRKDLLTVLESTLNKDEIELGVLDDIVATLAKGEKVLERRIMKGTPAQPGIDGKLLLLVKKFTGEGEVKIDNKGKANFRELHLFDNIVKGDVVARIYPPKPGVPGKDVLGKVVQASAGKPIKVPLDKTVSLTKRPNEDYEVVLAESDGFLVDSSGKLEIKGELTISGDLDLTVGNIDFVGAVRISGNVMPGMIIRGKKGVKIHGDIQEGIVESLEGDVVIDGFAHGSERAKIVSGQNISIAVAHNIQAEALGSINILKEALDCKFCAQATITGPKAVIVGGLARAVCGFEIGTLGNEAGIRTRFDLCTSIEASTGFAKLEIDIESHEKAMKLLEVHLGPYATSSTRVKLLKEPFKARIEGLLEKYKAIGESKAKLVLKKDELLKGAFRNPVQRINILQQMNIGSEIHAGDSNFKPDKIIVGPCSINYDVEKHEFIIGQLEPLLCESPLAKIESDKKGEKNGKPKKPK